MAHARTSRPDYGLGFQVNALPKIEMWLVRLAEVSREGFRD
jgi:hypothetical protein